MKVKKKIVLVVSIVIAAALAVGAGFAYAQEQERLKQIKEHDQAVRALYDERKAELDEIAASVDADAEKDALFAALADLEAYKDALEAERTGFELHDGALYKYDELQGEADELADAAKAYVVEGYEAQLAALVLDPNAEGVTKEALAENAAALQALANEVGADAEERDVWSSEDERAAFAAKVAEAVEADNAKIAEMEEAERMEAERIAAEQKAAEEAAAAAQNYGDGYSNSYSGGYSNSGGGNSGGDSTSGNGSYNGTIYWGTIGDENEWGETMYTRPDGTVVGGPDDGKSVWGD